MIESAAGLKLTTDPRFTVRDTDARHVAAIRKVCREQQHNRIQCPVTKRRVAVDAFTASAVITVHDSLNDANRAKFAACSIAKMAAVAWKLLK